MKPTRYNMHMAMVWLVQGCQAGDSLFFHFSGHGSQQRDLTGEEVDGYDETLCPVDYTGADTGNLHGRIIDHGVALGKGPTEEKHTLLVAVMTAKHRLILRYYSPLGKALSRITSTGAMTFCFIQAIERGHAQTYGSLLCAMRNAIRSANVNSGMGSGSITSLLEMLVTGGSLTGGLTQEPQLTSAGMFDINTPFHL